MGDSKADKFARKFLKKDSELYESNIHGDRRGFPIVTLLLVGTTTFIHYYWNHWNFERAKRNFVFTEMNAIQGNPHSAFLSPLSFEIPYYYFMNIPGLAISGFIIEKYLGSKVLLGLYLAN